MALDDATRARIQAAIAAGRVPTRTGSGRLYLRLGGRGAIPLTIAGDLLTPAGTFYYAESGSTVGGGRCDTCRRTAQLV